MKSLPIAIAALGLTQACLTPLERKAETERHLYGAPHLRANTASRQSASSDTGYPIGSGDRFKGGTVLPQGAGTTTNKDFVSILNINEVNSGLKALANSYSSTVKLFTAPQKTFEGRTMTGITVGNTPPRVFIEGGIHARERGGPDYVLYFIADLLAASKAGTGVKYGGKSYTAADVKTALGAGLVILPLVNPDGVNYDQVSGTCWRKNRNTASATSGDPDTVGIDLNRNFDFLWDYRHKFNQRANLGSAASDDPASEVFHGRGPQSEAETQNVVWVMDQNPSLSWFLDLHSFAGDILYAWGDDDYQSTDKTMSFTNSAYDGKRGYIGTDPASSRYKEYLQTVDVNAQKNVTSKMASSMNGAGSAASYRPLQSSNLYPTSGGSNDYALGRYYGGTCGAGKINGLAVEFGRQGPYDCPFYPTKDMYVGGMNQVAAGFMEFVLNAAGSAGQPVYVQC